MSPRPKGRISTSDLRQRVITAAWEQIALQGAPALSLREVARQLNITAPAIYNYYPNRDALVTALIVDAFHSMAEAQLSADRSVPAERHADRLMALGTAYREWAAAYPQRYQLIFGTPISGYTAPQEVTGPAAAGSLALLIQCLESAYQNQKLRIPADIGLSGELIGQMERFRSIHPVSHFYVLYTALVIWSRVHGLVSLEIGNQFPAFIQDFESMYRQQMDSIIREFLTSSD